MASTEDILRQGFDENIIPVALMKFDPINYSKLAAELDQIGFSLHAHIKNGTHAAVFETAKGDVARIDEFNSKIGQAEILNHSIVFQKAHEIEFPQFDVRIRLFIKGVDHDNGRVPDLEDVMRTLSMIDVAGKLDHVRDIGKSQLKFAYNPETKDLIRYPDGQAVGFIVDANSALEKPEDVARIVTGPLARDDLKSHFKWNDANLSAALAKIRGTNVRFLEASDAQYILLESVRSRYATPNQISAAVGTKIDFTKGLEV